MIKLCQSSYRCQTALLRCVLGIQSQRRDSMVVAVWSSLLVRRQRRWEEWDAATSRAMQRRALEGQARCGSLEAGYASDLEEDDM